MKQKKAQINSVGWQHTRVDNNNTNKAQVSRFCKQRIPSLQRSTIGMYETKISKINSVGEFENIYYM